MKYESDLKLREIVPSHEASPITRSKKVEIPIRKNGRRNVLHIERTRFVRESHAGIQHPRHRWAQAKGTRARVWNARPSLSPPLPRSN